jgi:hypothetical protein
MAVPKKFPAFPSIASDCSRESFLKERREMSDFHEQKVQCHKSRTKPGYAKIMSLAGKVKNGLSNL